MGLLMGCMAVLQELFKSGFLAVSLQVPSEIPGAPDALLDAELGSLRGSEHLHVRT